jgi:hypothetical protein
LQSLILKKLHLLSTTEKAARQVEFDPKRTLVHGANQTGKSCLLKSIYWVLGAEPAIINPRWLTADVIALLEFELDGATGLILRHKNQFAIFDSGGTLIQKFNKISSELGPYLADRFKFKLRLSTREGNTEVPPPVYLYLPYYVDQDAGWKSNWSSFKNLAQYPSWRGDVAEFHVGIRPGAYYELKGKKIKVESEKAANEAEDAVLEHIIARIRKTFNSAEFDIDLGAFEKEVSLLLGESGKLLKKENEYKAKFTELHTERTELLEQIKFAERAARDLEKDYRFATTDIYESEVHCPVCGTEYQNSFAERFSIASDEDRLLVLVADLRNRISAIDSDMAALNLELHKNSTELARITELLSVKRESITLKDVLGREGKREADSALNNRKEELARDLLKFAAELKSIGRELKALTDKTRIEEITTFYTGRMRSYLFDLKSSLQEDTYKKVDCSVKETGSNLPRALLAYYFSLLHTIQRYGDGTFCPIVIDSPNQQAQDKANLAAMLGFIRDNQPSGSQLILGFEEDLGLDIPGTRIELDRKYHLLQAEQYQETAEIVLPLLSAMLLLS